MLKGFGTCSANMSACLLIFSSFVSPPSDTAFGASETFDNEPEKVSTSARWVSTIGEMIYNIMALTHARRTR